MHELTVMKKGQVYKVICPKTREKTLIVTCADCKCFESGDSKIIKCEG